MAIPYVGDHNSKTKAQIKKLKTCGPPFKVGQQKLQKKFWSESHRFGVKSGQSVGVFMASPVIEVVR